MEESRSPVIGCVNPIPAGVTVRPGMIMYS
jgi:hypothetical protein